MMQSQNPKFITFLAAPIILQFLGTSDYLILRNSFKNETPIIEIFFEREPSMFGYNPKLTDNFTVFGMVFLITLLLGVLIFIIILYFNYIRILLKNKPNLSAATYKLQKILFKALYLQMCFITGILIVPIMISFILVMFGIKWVSSFGMICFMLTAIHSLADFAILTFYIKPYRKFILGLFKFLLNKVGFKFQFSSSVHPLIASTTVTSSVLIVPNN